MTARKNMEVFLKAIQIQGFKSFADKIRLDLQPGLSVIVGPNGSGKSNVADAVRWVLGEQSAKSLRGSKMEDVIFAGSSVRRPVGLAEVSLIFDNSSGLFSLDYEEVVITRRVYRDGEGQFFINKTPCRLKDIQELFMDTGSGKEGFSIIGQGRVEEILNLKSEERRLLIEEVAGISKYRLRKKEALKKLEDTQQNLNRLNDIIAEIGSRIEPLAKQAEAARACKKMNEELEKTEIKLIVNELSEINYKLKTSHTGMDDLNQELTVLSTRIIEDENQNIRSKYELNQLEERVQVLQNEVYGLENTVKETSYELSLLSERQGYAKDQLTRLEKEMSAAEEKIVQSDVKITSLAGKEAVLQNNLLEVSKILQSREKRLAGLKELSGGMRLEELKTEIFEEMSKRSKLVNEQAEIEHRKETLIKQENQIKQDLSAREGEKETLLLEIQEQETEKGNIEKRESDLQKRLEITKQGIEERTKEQLILEKNLSNVIRRMDQAGARRNALQTLEDHLEGYQKGVKETLFAFRKGDIRCSSIYGTVAENIDVEKKYELAVETALGNSLQNIIVETTEDGKQCIAYLKKTNNGRATFLPLDAIRGGRTSLDQKTSQHQGFQGLAVDLIRYDKKFQDIMESLLGRIFITDNMDSAIEIAKVNQYRIRVVTLQGDQVNIGGSLTGGSARHQSSGLLSRVREIEEITQKIKEYQTESEAEKQNRAILLKRLKNLALDKEDLEQKLKEQSEARGILAVERKHREDRIRRLEETLRLLHYELLDIKNQHGGFLEKDNAIAALIHESMDKIKQLQKEQASLEKLVKETNIEAQELAEEITSAKVESARWEQERDQTRLLIQDEKERLQKNSNFIEEKKQELTGIQQFEGELIKGQDEAGRSIQQATQELNEKKLQLVQLRKEKETFSSQTIQQEEVIHIKRRQAKDMEQQLHQYELRVARWQTEWETGCVKLGEEYRLTWDQAAQYVSQDKKDCLQEKILSLKIQIEEFGPVNYTALEEYPETLQRFEFMSSQRNDLIEAGNSLMQLIGELDKSMIERFEEGFKAVNEAFKEVFKQLFTGGNAELQMDDPDNLLETGVRIVAQPPGKKPQLLSLLSGGERSFTAIALLFAFLKVKPSPFCLLDEIEAALDEANVKRFVQYLHTLSDYTQFIVISHRRGTMESADRLYGITMEESGVSKLLTVELEDGETGSLLPSAM
ncbi:MAG: Chromosome partition protein Smc [Candidatus Dichloromethanomonas elyunquensis]|nr:MAG: Chromosome partition protein Smc [Candidatus Dichloromethanomonas elyunquensis]